MFPAASSLFPFESLLDSFIIIGYAGILLSIFHIYRSHLTSTQSLTHDEIQNFKKIKYVIKVILMVVISFFIILTLIDTMVFTFIPGTCYHLFSLIIIYSLLSYADISVKMGRIYSYEGAILKEEVKGARKIQFPKYYKFIWYGNAVALFLYCLMVVFRLNQRDLKVLSHVRYVN